MCCLALGCGKPSVAALKLEVKADGQDNNVKPEEVEGFKRMLQVVVPIGVGLIVIWKVVSRARAKKPPAGSTTVNVT
jgi:hypothetical protein